MSHARYDNQTQAHRSEHRAGPERWLWRRVGTFRMNLVELCTDDQHDAPCKFGNIVDGHACYCHADSPDAPRKCPIWRNHGEHDLTKWKRGPWDEGACPLFCANNAICATQLSHNTKNAG